MEHQSLPKYVQISEMLIREIAAGRLMDGERLPPEREMAKSLGTSVGTLRKALRELQGKGVLESVQGSGNYVRTQNDIASVYSLFRVELIDGGGLPTAQVLSVDTLPKPTEWNNSHSGALAHRIRRLRCLNNVPAVVEEIWLDQAVCPKLTITDLSDALYMLYRKRLGIWITHAEDQLTLKQSPKWAPDDFGWPADVPTLCAIRTSWDQENRPIEFSYNWINTNVARYISRIK